jgi:hypothetical protein
MTEPNSLESTSQVTNREDITSALFAQLILQQSNMALMLLGKVAHPETGQSYKDVEAARLFIDQLEMLETKTKGNLTREESALLKQTLMNLRLAFVEAVEQSEPQKPPADSSHSTPTPAQPASSTAETTGGSRASAEDEHRKKFSKKY